ncbi:MAG: hypothetical protein INH41_11100 [Myxococcaceae bacterium]|nr:hypothetical protein [Myxococcaceae bacterium]
MNSATGGTNASSCPATSAGSAESGRCRRVASSTADTVKNSITSSSRPPKKGRYDSHDGPASSVGMAPFDTAHSRRV